MSRKAGALCKSLHPLRRLRVGLPQHPDEHGRTEARIVGHHHFLMTRK
jgi:hypothetical protein